MGKSFKDLILLVTTTVFSTLLIWLPHFLSLSGFLGLDFSNGIANIYRNYDGLEYVVIAKTFYYPNLIAAVGQSLPANYYAAHFPGYSLAILALAPFLGFLKSMIFISLLFTISSVVAFYFLVRNFKLTGHPLALSIVFLFIPARWVIVRSVGSAEPMFIFLVLMAIYFFLKFENAQKMKFILLAAGFGSLAQFTRPPGILLFIALSFYILWKLVKTSKDNFFMQFKKYFLSYLPLIFIPFTLLVIFYWYSISYQDFFAYFHSGDNIHLTFPPFSLFNKNQYWVGDIWLEDGIYIFILGFLAGFYLIKKKLYPLAAFVLTYIIASSFVAHRDISRYTLPIFPFALIAFEKVLTSKEFRLVIIIVLFAIYLYSQNFLIENTAPIPNLELYN
ncbi:glycosyltransferase family 39 protein [Candidatus Daviesbacteria bacterium]|nr:glycosyltransferase family 39 protein [Candidatus Daviesbacteria bacterium]